MTVKRGIEREFWVHQKNADIRRADEMPGSQGWKPPASQPDNSVAAYFPRERVDL